MSQVVPVVLGDRSYQIHIGSGLLAKLDELLKPVVRGKKCLIVSDSTVAPIYADACAKSVEKLGIKAGVAVVPAGEGSKSGDQLFKLYDAAIANGLDRKSFVIALGGGVVGDLAGYMAASFLRGIQLIQIPTTLLAMVDSAVGGKTGINLPHGKNLVGAFHQPSLVVCDIDVLKSLPRRELVAGLAEVVKYGVIWDAELFSLLEREAEAIVGGDGAAGRDARVTLLAHLVKRSCEIKAEVVNKDEREDSLRAILNFGHTMGHAIEAVAGYGRFLHGEAISVGMIYAARLSIALCGFPQTDADRLTKLLARFGLPTSAPGLDWDALRKAMGVDKKNTAGKLKFVLAKRIGEVEFGCEVPEVLTLEAWNRG